MCNIIDMDAVTHNVTYDISKNVENHVSVLHIHKHIHILCIKTPELLTDKSLMPFTAQL